MSLIQAVNYFFCELCGAFTHHSSKICAHCRNYFLVTGLEQEVSGKNSYSFDHLVLTHWTRTNGLFIKALLTAQKNGRCPRMSNFFGQMLAEKFLSRPQVKCPEVIVPCPKKYGVKVDHAELLAKQVGEILGIPVVTSLLARSGREKNQKSASKRGRAEVQFKSKSCEIFKSVLFVDDVITTGFTVQAALSGLKNPSVFYALAIAERTSLHRAKSPDITHHDLC